MEVLIAEDEAVTRHVLENMLEESGYKAIVTKDGNEAWDILQQEDAPQMAILDW